MELANGVISEVLCAFKFANTLKDDWDRKLPLAEITINNSDSVLGGRTFFFFIDRGAHPRLSLSLQRDDRSAGESPAHYTRSGCGSWRRRCCSC